MQVQPTAWGPRPAAKPARVAPLAASCTFNLTVELWRSTEGRGSLPGAHAGPMMRQAMEVAAPAAAYHSRPSCRTTAHACTKRGSPCCTFRTPCLPGKNPWLMKAVAARWTAAPHAAGADRQQGQSLKQHDAAICRLREEWHRLGAGTGQQAGRACRWDAASRLCVAA